MSMKSSVASSVLTVVVFAAAGAASAAEWIAGSYVPPKETDTSAFFAGAPNDIVRKTFRAAGQTLRQATLRVAAPGMRDIWLNGTRVTSTALPPFTPYRKRILEESFDVTSFVKGGADNVLQIELGNGWWNLLPLKYWYSINLREHLLQGTPCVRAVLDIVYADGARQSVETDTGWEAASGRIVRNSIYTGVTVDARRTVGPWHPARVVTGPSGRICPAGDLPKTKIVGVWRAREVIPLGKGRWRIDFGVNFAGTYRARLRGVPKGGAVAIRSGERTFEDGRVNTLTAVAGQVKDPKRGPFFGVAEQCDTYISDGSPEAVFEPRLTFHVFRYLDVEGLDAKPTAQDFEALAWSADVAAAGSFVCSSDDLNALHVIAQRTFRSNMQGGVQSDCPGREKFGYGGDIAVSAESLRSNYAMAAFYRKVVRDFMDEAADDGLLTETAPYVGIGSRPVFPPAEANGRHVSPMGWTLGLPTMLDLLVRYDGDLAILREAYPTLVRYIDRVVQRYPTHEIPQCLGDWIALEKADETMSALCSWHTFVSYAAKFARLLDKPEDVRRFESLRDEVAKAFRTRYLKAGGVVNRGVQAEQLYALQGGLLPDAATERAAVEVLKRDLEKRGYAFTTGITTLGYLFEYLGSHGEAEVAGKCLAREGFPGFRHLLAMGATTLWESFDRKECENVYSNCHPMFGSFEAFFTRYILGIRVTDDAVGGDKVIVEPHPVAGVTWARGYLDVAKGRIEVSWKLENGRVQTEVKLPPGVTRVGANPDRANAAKPHVVAIDHPVMSPDEGLLLGNGDLSVSVYQTADDLVFRLGKGDVWDRRIDYSKQPPPPTIDEIIDGVLNCGWKVTGWNATNVDEMKKMPKGDRLLEITRGSSALRTAPYPCPKPTGEMRFRLPLDLGQPEKVVQRLFIEEGYATFDFSWRGGDYRARFEATVDPDENVVAVQWKVDGWQEDTRIEDKPPVYVSVHRWADPDYESWLRREVAQYPSYPGKPKEFKSGVTPLPLPQVVSNNQIEQGFPPDPLFPNGFRYRLTLTPLVRCGDWWRPTMPAGERDAYFTYQGGKTTTQGAVALAVTTSRDKTLQAPAKRTFAEYRARAAKAGAAYWSKSSFSMPNDAFLENLWYSTYHARRCVLKAGAVPPGLFFPSALPDYSRWNGDYHANYNFQSIFWGDFTANRLDQAENFMDGVEYAVPVGREIAKKYYNCRGCFFQLQQFPCRATEDYNGTLPLGRMAYMTGWMMNHYWEYYQYTRDRAWLAKRGYPMMKDCALFYLDFLKKAPHPQLPPELKDGKYHLFPSVQGESGFKTPQDFCDKDQVVVHCRHALYAAIESARILGVDADLQAQWQERLDNLVRSERLKNLSPYEKFCTLYRSPDDGSGEPWKPAKKWDGKPGKARQNYLGITHWAKNGAARSNNCIPERDFATWRGDLKRWCHPNGLVWAMAIRIWQRTGAWTESLSCMAPFQEMALQSWDGAIRLFPRWPASQDVSFRSWRAQGAFLVDADFANGKIGNVAITSEKGEDCLVWGEWKVMDAAGRAVATDHDAFGRLRFKTAAGQTYSLVPASANR